jgi:hypothetical protein
MATQPHPRFQFLAALMLAAVVLSSAITIKDDGAANLAPPASHARSAGMSSAATGDSLSRTPQAGQARMLAAYGELPLINQGQTDRRVKFLSRGSGYSLFLTANEAVLTLRKGNPSPKIGSNQTPHPSSAAASQLRPAIVRAERDRLHGSEIKAAVLRMTLVDANAKAKITGLEELPSKSNYFVGNDAKKWRTNVPNYAKVENTNVYPGVNLVYYGNQRELEYDFVLAPGADPRRISERTPYFAHGRVDAVGAIQEDSLPPDSLNDLFARD